MVGAVFSQQLLRQQSLPVRNNDLQSIHIKLKIEQHKHHLNPVVNAGGLEGLEVPAPHLTPVVLLSYDTNII
jgi:hypothetical protein